MCGIAGFLNLNDAPAEEHLVVRMADRIAHRGPDSCGSYVSGALALGHRRLRVVDLSERAAQPLTNETGEIVVNYNGEIYDFMRHRRELEEAGHVFRSRSDTEVLVHGYEEWGTQLLERLNGMFAFALWDEPRRRLVLARDRYGIKPLYWYCRGDLLAFASEVKALLAHPHIRAELCADALDEYLTFQNVLSDLTLFEGVKIVPPGHTLTVEAGGEPRLESFWDFDPALDDSLRGQAAVEAVYETFRAGVQRQLVADVPVGSYLSGGMDSGSITAVAAMHLPRLTTFTGGFDLSSASGLELGFDEREQAEALANAFRTEHYEAVMHAGHMEWVLPQLTWHIEDLRVGQSYPNYYLARLASSFVTVVLSGTGGDELFAGYPWRYAHAVSSAGREDYLRSYYRLWQRLVSDDEKPALFRPDITRQLSGRTTFEAFCSVYDGWDGEYESIDGRVAASLYFELKTFLHGLLLVEDKISMAHSLETRVPFLDDDLAQLALRIPVGEKLRELRDLAVDENVAGFRQASGLGEREGKVVLRNAMKRLMPQAVVERRKQGFSAPDASWFRGESISYIDRLLGADARIFEFLERAYVERVLEEHRTGQRNRRLLIWSFLSLEWWSRLFLDGVGPPDSVEALRSIA
jgi:asparagine synthase (glutamine-hydrolysing)